MRPGKNSWLLLAVLCLASGVANIDMLGISYVAPLIEKGLNIDNTQFGLLLSGFWLTFAISNYVTGAVADRHRNHKTALTVMLVLFAFGSVLPALTSMFATLLAARLLVGVFDAGVYQLPQSIVLLETPAERHGRNTGIVQNLGGVFLGGVVAPLLLVRLAQDFSWRAVFLVVALPGLVCAALIARYVPARRAPEDTRQDPSIDRKEGVRLGDLLRIRNVWLSAVISCLILGCMTIEFAFLPLYLMKVGDFEASRMSIVMSVMGLSGVSLGVILPTASDRIGRKSVMIATSALGMATPLAALYYGGPLAALCVFAFIGTAFFGTAPLAFATIPCESAPPEATSTVLGFILAISSVVGGAIAPAIAGWSADRWGLAAPLYLTAACCVVVGLLCAVLIESAPRKRKDGSVADSPVAA